MSDFRESVDSVLSFDEEEVAKNDGGILDHNLSRYDTDAAREGETADPVLFDSDDEEREIGEVVESKLMSIDAPTNMSVAVEFSCVTCRCMTEAMSACSANEFDIVLINRDACEGRAICCNTSWCCS